MNLLTSVFHFSICQKIIFVLKLEKFISHWDLAEGTWVCRSKQGYHLTCFSACDDFLGFVQEAVVTHWEWKVKSTHKSEVRERKLPCWSSETLCDFLSMFCLCCFLCSLPCPSPHFTPGLWKSSQKSVPQGHLSWLPKVDLFKTIF